MDEATAATWRAEARSTVAFDIEGAGHGVVKLTVTHDGFAPGSAVLSAISEGWPAVLASLETFRLGIPCPPYGRPDPDGVSVFRTRETRLAQGALFTPGTAVPSPADDLPAARLPLSCSQSPFIPDYNPPREVIVMRHQQGFTVVHPTPAFPSPVTLGGTGSSGFP